VPSACRNWLRYHEGLRCSNRSELKVSDVHSPGLSCGTVTSVELKTRALISLPGVVAARRVRLQPKSRTRQEEHSFASSYAFLLIRNSKVKIRNNLTPIPYPKLSAEDWRVWRTFLPIRSQNVDKLAACNLSSRSLYFSQGIPYAVTEEIKGASQYFDRIEVWRKSEVNKDPIAVGVMGDERYF